MKRGQKYLAVGLFVLVILSAGIFINATLGELKEHSETEVNGIFDNGDDDLEITLQEAIDNPPSSGGNLLINNGSNPRSLSNPLIEADPGHKVGEIWISTKEAGTRKEMWLNDSFKSARNLCGDPDFNGVYASQPNPSMTAAEVEVSIGGTTKSLQEAIDDRELLYTRNQYFRCDVNASTGSSGKGSRTTEDVYYYNSCSVQEGKKNECGPSGYITGNFCNSANNVVKTYNTTGCFSTACNSSTRNDLVKTCAGNRCFVGSCYEGSTDSENDWVVSGTRIASSHSERHDTRQTETDYWRTTHVYSITAPKGATALSIYIYNYDVYDSGSAYFGGFKRIQIRTAGGSNLPKLVRDLGGTYLCTSVELGTDYSSWTSFDGTVINPGSSTADIKCTVTFSPSLSNAKTLYVHVQDKRTNNQAKAVVSFSGIYQK